MILSSMNIVPSSLPDLFWPTTSFHELLSDIIVTGQPGQGSYSSHCNGGRFFEYVAWSEHSSVPAWPLHNSRATMLATTIWNFSKRRCTWQIKRKNEIISKNPKGAGWLPNQTIFQPLGHTISLHELSGGWCPVAEINNDFTFSPLQIIYDLISYTLLRWFFQTI